MSVLKIRGEDGVVREVVSLKGEGGLASTTAVVNGEYILIPDGVGGGTPLGGNVQTALVNLAGAFYGPYLYTDSAMQTNEQFNAQTFCNALNGKAEGELVTLRDVSPVRHNVGVAVNRKNLLSVGTVVVNEFKELVRRTDTPLPAGTYTFSTTVTNCTDTDDTRCFIYWELSDGSANGQLFERNKRISATFTVSLPINYLTVYAGVNYANSIGDTATYEDCQLEVGTTATPYSPYVDDIESVKVQVLGKNLANKAELIQMPGSASRKYLDLYLQAGKYYYSSNLHSASGVTFYTGIVHEGEVSNQNNVQQFSTFSSSQDEGAFTIAEGGAYRFLIYCSTAAICDTLNGAWDDVWIQIEQGNAKTEYEPYKPPVEYEQGEAIPSVYPSMTVTTDTDGVLVSVEYNRDINKALETLTKAIISLGGNV